ncbi:MAG: YihY/virulence factor BrkB family protein [Bacillota bacterium]|nr:YihY/virulence factor BrkB family protein [Bacillota bacterium]
MNTLIQRLNRRFGHLGAYRFIVEFIGRVTEDQVPQVGAQLAFYLLLSLFPFFIALLTFLTYTPLAADSVIAQLASILPDEAENVVIPIIRETIDSRSTALLSTSLAFAIWSGSSGISNMLRAMDHAFNVPRQRNLILRRLIAIFATLLLLITMIIALLGQVFGRTIMNFLVRHLGDHELLHLLGTVARFLLPLVTMVVVFAAFYLFGPSFRRGSRIGFGPALLGAVFTTIGWTLMSAGFSFYVSNFTNFATTYGSLGGVIILLIWLYLTSTIILLGAEVAASYIAVRSGRDSTGMRVRPTSEVRHD